MRYESVEPRDSFDLIIYTIEVAQKSPRSNPQRDRATILASQSHLPFGYFRNSLVQTASLYIYCNLNTTLAAHRSIFELEKIVPYRTYGDAATSRKRRGISCAMEMMRKTHRESVDEISLCAFVESYSILS